ncbi:hypothetical protein MMC25_007595 [Agyrium rufum]|nr:hypothetical protein [Agyrium rufum]
MPLISSPVAYPPNSSLTIQEESRKRNLDVAIDLSKKRKLLGRTLISTTSVQHLQSTSSPYSPKYHSQSHEAEKENQNPEKITRNTSAVAVCQLPRKEASLLPCGGNVPVETDDFALATTSHSEAHAEPPTIQSSGEQPPVVLRTCSGKRYVTRSRAAQDSVSYERLIASRSNQIQGRAQKSFYGIDIHSLIEQVALEKKSLVSEEPASPTPVPIQQSIEKPLEANKPHAKQGVMWTEKYRARKFTDLVGDERTHRSVLKWLKGWDPVVFPGSSKIKPTRKTHVGDFEEESIHRKILLMTGPPGLGKTTLAHVCAKQAGYEVVEINASDERGRDVVKGKIRDCVGTENVRGVNVKSATGTTRKAGRPVCVVVDEVDGVITGSSGGGGEGGFIKALIDLILLDQKNNSVSGKSNSLGATAKKTRKGDRFRLLRPMILICNDVYATSLKPLRASNLAEIIHVRKPPLDKVIARMKTIFEKENIPAESDGIRRLCEATWGISSRRDKGLLANDRGQGDLRSILVAAESAASRMRGSASLGSSPRLTRQWIEQHVAKDLTNGQKSAGGSGYGGSREAVERVFLDGAGFPRSGPTESSTTLTAKTPESIKPSQVSVTDANKRHALSQLHNLVSSINEPDRIIADCFLNYPTHPFQDDVFLSKPNAANDWLHFHDLLSSKVFSGQEWELGGYLNHSILAFHHLFASSKRSTHSKEQEALDAEEFSVFLGPRADFAAFEAEKANRAMLQQLHGSLSLPLMQGFRSSGTIAVDLVPYTMRMLTPDVKPVVVGGSGEQRGTVSVRREGEREMVRRGLEAMAAVGVTFERVRVEDGRGGYVYRMEPPLDTLSTFETSAMTTGQVAPTRYAVRQVLDQEFQKYALRQRAAARQARMQDVDVVGELSREALSNGTEASNLPDLDLKTGKPPKKDFFGRVIREKPNTDDNGKTTHARKQSTGGRSKVWVSFNEGFSNAVRKKVTLAELMNGFS